ncbi:hypothetical protein [Candidatus Nitrotoga arctica]|uniref:Uncharacterized protein n=1 Tax=Candidatus Nitrotoga arctica TaxID=453162 RepID=A0ABN8AKQ7_9PROT|nr:hypothetical protein [Candidatus Nitrotoga arctica]CAG9932219.1 conserved exported protein of unknown function [Candidatus Nitrotoga arctica]
MNKSKSAPIALSIALLLSVVTTGVHAEEEDKRSPLEKFQGGTHFHFFMCQLTARKAELDVKMGNLREPYTTVGACVKDGKSAVKALFPKAISPFASKPEASKLLKEYYVLWLTAMDSVKPDINEDDSEYEKRQKNNDRKLNEAWHRFEIEAEI